MKLLELRNITASYDHQQVLRKVDLTIQKGEYAGLVGPSGAGKTTILKVILGLIPIQAGVVEWEGQDITGTIPDRVGYVPQLETVDWSFPITVMEVVLMGRFRSMSIWPWAGKEDKEAASHLLQQLGIFEYRNRQISELSGGQQQRVFLARALIGKPDLLLLDEPTSGADVKTRHDILHLLDSLHQEGITIFLTTHDLNAVAAHLPHLICFNKKVIAQGPPKKIYTPDILSKTYDTPMNTIRHTGAIGDFSQFAAYPHDPLKNGESD